MTHLESTRDNSSYCLRWIIADDRCVVDLSGTNRNNRARLRGPIQGVQRTVLILQSGLGPSSNSRFPLTEQKNITGTWCEIVRNNLKRERGGIGAAALQCPRRSDAVESIVSHKNFSSQGKRDFAQVDKHCGRDHQTTGRKLKTQRGGIIRNIVTVGNGCESEAKWIR
jgi:hypothetical protein